jgi:hypothetical protein
MDMRVINCFGVLESWKNGLMVVNGEPGRTLGKLSSTVAVMSSFPICRGSF